MIYRLDVRVQNILKVAGLACSVIVILAGCSINEFAVNTTAPVLLEASKAFSAENDVVLAREASAASLKTADGFLISSPESRELLEVLARGYVEYTFGFLEDDLEAMPDDNAHHEQREVLVGRCTNLYDRALGYGLRLVATYNKNIPAAFKKDLPGFEAELAKLKKKAAPGLLFTGMALASAINLNRADIARVAELPKAVALVKRSYELDPHYYNGIAAMTLGLVNASQGKAMGGNPEAAKKYFEEAIAETGGKYLLARVMQARFYAVVTQDRPLFEKILKDVIAAPADALPSARLPNELAHRRAARYLKLAEDLF